MEQQVNHELLLEATRLLVQINPDNFIGCKGDPHSMLNLRHAIKLSLQGLGMPDPVRQTEMKSPDWKEGLVDNIEVMRASVANRLVQKMKDNGSIGKSAPSREWEMNHNEWNLVVTTPAIGKREDDLVLLSLDFETGQSFIVDATLGRHNLPSSLYNPSEDIHEKQMDAILLLFRTLKTAKPWRHFGYDYEISKKQILDTWHNEIDSISRRYHRDIMVDVGASSMIYRMNVSFEPDNDKIIQATFGSIDITSLSDAIAIANDAADLNEADKTSAEADESAFQP